MSNAGPVSCVMGYQSFPGKKSIVHHADALLGRLDVGKLD